MLPPPLRYATPFVFSAPLRCRPPHAISAVFERHAIVIFTLFRRFIASDAIALPATYHFD